MEAFCLACEVRAGLGLLVLDGLLIRRIELAGRFAAELLGPGDLLRPWQEDDEVASVSRTSGWRSCAIAVSRSSTSISQSGSPRSPRYRGS